MKLSTSPSPSVQLVSRFYRSLAVCSLLCISNVGMAAIVPGDLLITEVMANPASVGDTQGEWFEIYNRSGQALDLTGLVIRDAGSNTHTLSGPLTIAVDSYFVLGRSSDSAVNGGYTANYQYSNFTLGNSSDEIILEFSGSIVDSVSYSGDPAFGIAGVSAELTRTGFLATPAGMVFGSGDIGTPGSAGSDPTLGLTTPSPVPVPAAGWLMATALGTLVARTRRRS